MDLPKNIESEVLDYLHLEFGETKSELDALKIVDLKYEGIHEIEGVSHHCWSFPSTTNNTWATVKISGQSYSIGIVESPSATKEITYDYLYVDIWEAKSNIIKVPLTYDEENKISYTENDFAYSLVDGDALTISCEILRTYIPHRFSVSITHNERTIEMHGEVKGVLDYDINETTGVKVIVGGEKWL